MVGFSPENDELSKTSYAVAGGLSGVATRTIVQPLDVVKIRFQLQTEPTIGRSTAKYRGVLNPISTIIKDESARALWKGHITSQLLTAAFMSAEFLTYEVLTKAVYNKAPDELRYGSNFMCGAGAGIVGTVVSYPLDLIRTRFVAQGNHQVYKTIAGAVHSIYTTSGVPGFYRGLWAAVGQAAPQGALHYGCFSIFVQALRSINLSDGNKAAVAGAGSGFIAKLLLYPFDTTKRRLQIMEFSHGRKGMGRTVSYCGVWDCLTRLIKEEGIRGPFKGISWALVKSTMATSLYFYFYVWFSGILRTRQTKDSDP